MLMRLPKGLGGWLVQMPSAGQTNQQITNQQITQFHQFPLANLNSTSIFCNKSAGFPVFAAKY
jgi:hypothetical protein